MRRRRILCAKIEAIKRACAHSGTDVFVNARTDVYLRGLVPVERRIEETLAREVLYRAAGADGLFVPGIADRGEIGVDRGTRRPATERAAASAIACD